MTQDIFSAVEQRPTGAFFSFKQIGDAVQGTFIDKYDGVDSYNNEQSIIVLKGKDGSIHNVGIKKTDTFLLDDVEKAVLGDVVGFRYEEDKPSKKYPGKTKKIIRFYRDALIVDAAWLAERAERAARFNLTAAAGPSAPSTGTTDTYQHATAPTSAQPVTPAVPVQPAQGSAPFATKLEAIRNLARTQGLTTPEMTPEQQDVAIISFSGLPLDEANATQVIIKLTGYTK